MNDTLKEAIKKLKEMNKASREFLFDRVLKMFSTRKEEQMQMEGEQIQQKEGQAHREEKTIKQKEQETQRKERFTQSYRQDKNKRPGQHYVMSDLHGMYGTYRNVLDELGNNDMLYILGDVLDRGNGGLKILDDIMKRQQDQKNNPKIAFMLGNHELMFLETMKIFRQHQFTNDEIENILYKSYINDYIKKNSEKPNEIDNINSLKKDLIECESKYQRLISKHKLQNGEIAMIDVYANKNRGYKTIAEFREKDMQDQNNVLNFLNNSYISLFGNVNGRDVMLVHSMPPQGDRNMAYIMQKGAVKYSDPMLTFEDKIFMLQNRENQMPDTYLQAHHIYQQLTGKRGLEIICGHTPNKDRLVNYNSQKGYTRIDCGSGHGGQVGVYNMDTMEAEYFRCREDVTIQSEKRADYSRRMLENQEERQQGEDYSRYNQSEQGNAGPRYNQSEQENAGTRYNQPWQGNARTRYNQSQERQAEARKTSTERTSRKQPQYVFRDMRSEIKGKEYVISDVRGMQNMYNSVIQKLNKNDTLTVLGNVLNKDGNGFKILQDMMKRNGNPKIDFVMGDSEMTFLESISILAKHKEVNGLVKCITDRQKFKDKIKGLEEQNHNEELEKLKSEFEKREERYKALKGYFDIPESEAKVLETFIGEREGSKLIEQFLKFDVEEQKKLALFLRNSYVALPKKVNGKDYLLVHSSPPIDEKLIKEMKKTGKGIKYLDVSLEEKTIILGEEKADDLNYRNASEEGFTTIFGNGEKNGKAKRNEELNAINIDANGGKDSRDAKMALYCIDDDVIEYVEEKQQER